MLEQLITIALAQGFKTEEAQAKMNETDEVIIERTCWLDVEDDFPILPKKARAKRRMLTRRFKRRAERLVRVLEDVDENASFNKIAKAYRNLNNSCPFGWNCSTTRSGIERIERADKLHRFERMLSEY